MTLGDSTWVIGEAAILAIVLSCVSKLVAAIQAVLVPLIKACRCCYRRNRRFRHMGLSSRKSIITKRKT